MHHRPVESCACELKLLPELKQREPVGPVVGDDWDGDEQRYIFGSGGCRDRQIDRCSERLGRRLTVTHAPASA